MSNNSELITYLQQSFSSRTTLNENGFSILSSISKLGADPKLQEMFQEFVLRALDARQCFKQYADLLNSITRRAGLYPYLEQSELSLRDQMAF